MELEIMNKIQIMQNDIIMSQNQLIISMLNKGSIKEHTELSTRVYENIKIYKSYIIKKEIGDIKCSRI